MLSSKSRDDSSPIKSFKKEKGLRLYGAICQTTVAMDELYPPNDSVDRPTSDDDPLLESLRRNSRLMSPRSIHSSVRESGCKQSMASSLADAMAIPSEVGVASITSEVMSITKNLLGAGVLSLSKGIATYSNDPSAMISATVWILLLGGMFGYFCLLIAKICQKTRSATYRECWETTMGDRGGMAVSIVSALLPAQGNLSATTVLTETLQSLLETFHIYWSRLTCLLVLTIFVLLPICLMKDLNSISHLSTLGVASMGVATVAMMIRYFDGSYQEGGIYFDTIKPDLQPSFGNETAWNVTILPFVCMVFNSYIMHYNSPRFYMELKDRSIPRFTLAVGWSFGLSGMILILIAGSGYLTFGEHSSSYILNNYSPDDPLATASRIGVFLSTLLMYPIAFFGVRDGVLDVFGVPHYLQTDRNLDSVSVLVLFLLTICANFCHDLGTINAVGGGALATCLCIIFPALMYRQLVVKAVESNAKEIVESWVTLFLMVVGILLGVSGAYQSLI
jgi:amino acid permease